MTDGPALAVETACLAIGAAVVAVACAVIFAFAHALPGKSSPAVEVLRPAGVSDALRAIATLALVLWPSQQLCWP